MKRHLEPIILVLMIVLAVPALSSAAERYVLQGATGANNGTTWTDAYTSLPSTLVRGYVYYIADGSYGSYTFDDAVSGSENIYIKKATIADHGSEAGAETGWNDSYGDGQAVLTYLGLATSYVSIDGQTGGGPSAWESGHGIAVRNLSSHLVQSSGLITNIILKHIEIDGTSNAPGDRDAVYMISGATDLSMQYVYIHDIGCDIFQLRGNITRFTLEYSKLARNNQDSACHGDVFEYDGATALDWIHRYNLFEDTVGTYLWGSHTSGLLDNAQIYGNIITGGAFNNGMISGLSNGGIIANLKFYNNTIVNVGGFNAGTQFLSRGVNNYLYNNLYYFNTVQTVIMGGTHDYNWFYNAGSQSEQNIQNGTGNLSINLGSNDFALIAATDAGLTLSSPYNTDIYGNIRGEDGLWDRGAYEFNSGNIIKRPSAPSSLRFN